jgi:DNA processing protein
MVASSLMGGATSILNEFSAFSEVTINDRRYPELLKNTRHIDKPPKSIYYKGTWRSELFEMCLGVVGSRRMTSYGKRAVQKLVYEIACKGITIVSGFMYGIDASAHRACIDGGGKTIAVMPCGIESIYPPDQLQLYREIIDTGGLILSEYDGCFPPMAWTYVKRNRIVAGLSKAVMVVEAEQNSGSLITADYAKKYGRKVLAVPGEITSDTSRGTLDLIAEGAWMVRSADDVMEAMGMRGLGLELTQDNGRNRVETCSNLGEVTDSDARISLETKIFNILRSEALNIDEITRLLRQDLTSVSSALMMLIIRGEVVEEGGKYYVN